MCSYIWFAIHPLFIKKKKPTFDSSKEKREKKDPRQA